MIRVQLTLEQRGAVQALRHDPPLRPAERDRVEMVLLSAEGWSPPRIARSVGCHPATVRQTLKRVATNAPTDLRWRRPGPPLASNRGQFEAPAESGACRPGRAGADQSQKKSAAGELRLVYLDECGFSPS